MTLFSAPDEPASHRTRIVLAEKDVEIEIVSVTPGRFPEDLIDLNPDHSLPTLVDRDLVLYTVDFVRTKPYFVSDELSLVDVTIAPILWRLPRYRIDLPKEAAPLL